MYISRPLPFQVQRSTILLLPKTLLLSLSSLNELCLILDLSASFFGFWAPSFFGGQFQNTPRNFPELESMDILP